jgi:diacylglycerol O-acyltransferase
MADAYVNETLPFADAFFLYVEQPGAPTNVAAVSEFEGAIRLDQCMEYIESKLPLIPRFLARVVIPPLSVGPPTLQYDRHFDLRNHVREVKLKRGTDREWKAAVSEILSTHLDRSRPLWDFTLIHGLKGERTGVVIRIHHCLVDGVAGVGLINLLLDASPAIPKLSRKKKKIPVPPPVDPGSVLLEGLVGSCFSTGQALLTVYSELLRMAQQASVPVSAKGTNADEVHAAVRPLAWIGPLGNFSQLVSELVQPTERLPFNVLCRGPQKFEWTCIPMEEIAAVREAGNATVNEVVLTILSSALRRYAELHNITVKGRKLRLVVPVNVRAEGQSSAAGNQITFLPVDTPFSGRDPRKLLSLVQKRFKFSKAAHGAELVGVMAVLLSALPPPLQRLTGDVLSRLPISLCNSICTNVPGPKTPLYLLGHKLLSAYPYVPIGGEMGMNCAVMSYSGTLFVGFTGDAQAIPDLPKLATFFTESFAELRDAFGISPPAKARLRKARIASSKPKDVPLASGEITPPDVLAFESEAAPAEEVASGAS